MESKQRSIIVGVKRQQQNDFDYLMKELKQLSIACDMEVVGELTQSLQRVNTFHYIGKGKLKELKLLLEETGSSLAIFNDELSASQIRNLESELNCTVYDRTMLILDIFARRAKTREAKLQVEVAQLQYQLPRLIGKRESLGRQGGGAGLKNRGSGETKLELDRRKIEGRIAALNKELERLVSERHTQRSQRQKNQVPVVSLVGYTNAGKSTIMNAMVDRFNRGKNKQVFEKDMLFATLETAVRQIHLPDNKTFLLSDTVGFVSGLPHELVKAFRSTFEEVIEADVLIHVVDYSNPKFEQHIEVTQATLNAMGATDIPVVYAYNKADLKAIDIPKVDGKSVFLSAKQNIGIDALIEEIRAYLFKDFVQCEMLVPFDQGQLVSYFNETANVLSTRYEQEGTILRLECHQQDFDKYQEFVI
ncbi:GTP-binding protein HflX [Pullulanibacillus pueri]|uniref:GTPase HflX n=1 Tax=Pullulanibacillus pueri TaxID=1437324 RepID=A0A8J2ZVA0_9BACL|nr:GTPase HflX [Pullulanibacillus pueri]MBM7682089.1 GTP-binding protein HflX [Pullulanibacillus pueri]GGH80025.1 GTPase HflX [Pullulanibacillus pueri]